MTEIKLLLFLERSLPIGTYRVTLESAQCSQIHANIMLDDVGGLRLCFCMPFSFSPETASQMWDQCNHMRLCVIRRAQT